MSTTEIILQIYRKLSWIFEFIKASCLSVKKEKPLF